MKYQILSLMIYRSHYYIGLPKNEYYKNIEYINL